MMRVRAKYDLGVVFSQAVFATPFGLCGVFTRRFDAQDYNFPLVEMCKQHTTLTPAPHGYLLSAAELRRIPHGERRGTPPVGLLSRGNWPLADRNLVGGFVSLSEDTPASKIQLRPSSFGLCEKVLPGTSRSRLLCLAGLSAYEK